MSTRPIITVIGATGAQGGGLARAILADPARSFVVRAVTCQPEGAAARAMAAQGAEVVRADLGDAASRHVIWSTRQDIRPQVPHVDAKSAADALFGQLPTTYLRTSFFWDNLLQSGMGPRRGADGVLELVLPRETRRLPGIAAADVGPCALGIFQRCGQFIGSTVGIAGEHLTGPEMAAALSDAIGESVRHVPVSFADYRKLGFPAAGDLARMSQYQDGLNDACCAERPVERSRELHPDIMDFERWLARHIHRIPVPDATGIASSRSQGVWNRTSTA